MRAVINLFFFFFLFLNLACKHSEKGFRKKENNKKMACNLSGNAANNEAIIKAKIVSIVAYRDTSDLNNPCNKEPCIAFIKIEEITKKGSLFVAPSDPNEYIKVNFVFTLSETNQDLFPGSEKWYPGLKINDKFEAVIQSRIAPGNKINYLIYDYKKND